MAVPPHLQRVAFAVKEDIALDPMRDNIPIGTVRMTFSHGVDPIDVGLLSTFAVMTRAKGDAHLIEEFRFGRRGLPRLLVAMGWRR